MIENKLLTTNIESIFTSPGTPGDINVQSAVTTMIFCNVSDVEDSTLVPLETAGSASVDVYIAKYGQTPDPLVNAIIKNLVIPAGETLFFDTERVVLSAGDVIYARANNANMVVATVSVLPV